MLFQIFDMQRINRRHDGGQMEHQPEDKAQFINPNHRQRLTEHVDLPKDTKRRQQEYHQTGQRQREASPSGSSSQQR